MDVRLEGYRGAVPPIRDLVERLAALAAKGAEAQLLRADRVAGADHLRAAALHADRAFERGRAVASTWPLEVLRYAAGERQLGRALAFLGLDEGPGRTIAAVVRGAPAPFHALAAGLGWERDDGVLDGDDATLDHWGFTAEERTLAARPGDLVLERVALADVAR